MKFEDISKKEDLVNFFENKGFIIQEYDDLIKIDDSHFLKFEILDFLDNEVGSQKHREFKKLFKTEIQYLLLVDKTFTKFFFYRDYGTPIKFSFEQSKNYAHETRLALSKKLNSLDFTEDDFNESLNNLFDIKEIVNKFYFEYRSIKNKLAKAIKNLNGNTHDYAQIVLDRFIFIYFLQTKGILTKFYLSDLYYNKEKRKGFYKDYLKPLFFECLNTEHDPEKNRIINGINFGKIPYLNGGLFSEKQIEVNSPDIEIDDKVWDSIFNLLNKYEWVVEEEKGDSTTLTPAILGHIFEKSMTEDKQKGTGSFYTPEEITNYISKNTIYPFLQDKLNKKFGIEIKNLFTGLLDKEKLSKKEIEQVSYLYEQVKKITILDNACGSGAFLIAAQHILFPIYKKCTYKLRNEPFFKEELAKIKKHHSINYYVKRTIITNNLHGVDIQEGAVDIAKLRLWLSMVSEMKLELSKIEPLPNIEYNILCGNSLIGFTKAVKTGGLQEHLELDISDSINVLKFTFPNVSKELQELSKSPNIENLIKIKERLVELFRKETNSKVSKMLREVLVNIDEKLQEKLDLLFLNHVNTKVKRPIIDLYKSSKEQIKEFSKNLSIFHWILEFPDIMRNGESGFDIIIGNPPYGNILTYVEKIMLEKVYHFYSVVSNNDFMGTFNGASVFTEKSYYLINESGYFGYIIPNSIARVGQFSRIREFLLKKANLYHVVDEANPFPDVTLEMISIFFNKKSQVKEITVLSRRKGITIKENKIDKSIFERYNHFMLYHDKLFDIIAKDSAFGVLDATRGGDIPYKYVSDTKDKKYDIPYLYSGKSVKKYYINDSEVSFTTDYYKCKKSFVEAYNNIMLISTKIYSFPRAIIKPKGYVFGAGIIRIIVKDSYDKSYLCAILNSKLIEYLCKKYLVNLSNLTTNLNTGQLPMIPIKKEINQEILAILANYLIFLNSSKSLRKQFNDTINNIDTNIVNSLVYEIYIGSELKTNLTKMVKPFIKDISNLKENKKISVINEFVKKISDAKINNEILKIKNNKWVKIIEGNV